MKQGKCKLCEKEGELQESHLLPAAVYRMCRSENEEIADPVGILNDPKIKAFRVYQSSRQITGQVLCHSCEQTLNSDGEDWVLPNLSTLQGFPLFEKLKKIKPEIAEEDLAVYACTKVPEIRTDALAHFAIGVFWKAGVYDWQTGRGPLRLEFGSYTEEMRKFLLGVGAFPLHAYLIINVVPPSYPTISAYLPCPSKAFEFPFYSFYVPGVEFMLTLGEATPNFLRAFCISTNSQRPVMSSPSTAQFIGKRFAEAFESGHVPKKLAGRLQEIRAKKN